MICSGWTMPAGASATERSDRAPQQRWRRPGCRDPSTSSPSQKCLDLGGYLPTAAQLIGAASRVKLTSVVGDSEVTASTDVDASDGLKDRREMSATLTTTASGSRAAGSQGVSEEARGDPRAGEPDPIPQPANPSPRRRSST